VCVFLFFSCSLELPGIFICVLFLFFENNFDLDFFLKNSNFSLN
jgi:hypothetical protein